MYAIKKHKRSLELWEFENQRQLIRFFQSLKFALLKIAQKILLILSLLAYLAYRGLKLIYNFFEIFLIEQGEASQILERENQRRIELSACSSLWIK